MILDIVVDVQKDFITGALANPQAQANVAHLAETVKAHARAGHWLFLTRDTHPDNYLATREGRHLPVEHCIEGEDGWNFAPELENALDGTDPEVCHIVNKPTFCGFFTYHGMTAEQVLWAWFKSEILCPKRLMFKSDSYYYEAMQPAIRAGIKRKRGLPMKKNTHDSEETA